MGILWLFPWDGPPPLSPRAPRAGDRQKQMNSVPSLQILCMPHNPVMTFLRTCPEPPLLSPWFDWGYHPVLEAQQGTEVFVSMPSAFSARILRRGPLLIAGLATTAVLRLGVLSPPSFKAPFLGFIGGHSAQCPRRERTLLRPCSQ